MAMLGMDVDQADGAVSKINSQSGQLQTLISQLNSTVTGLSSFWTGSDATQFVGTVWPSHKSNLDKVKADLDQLSSDLKKEIEQQRQTSAS